MDEIRGVVATSRDFRSAELRAALQSVVAKRDNDRDAISGSRPG